MQLAVLAVMVMVSVWTQYSTMDLHKLSWYYSSNLQQSDDRRKIKLHFLNRLHFVVFFVLNFKSRTMNEMTSYVKFGFPFDWRYKWKLKCVRKTTISIHLPSIDAFQSFIYCKYFQTISADWRGFLVKWTFWHWIRFCLFVNSSACQHLKDIHINRQTDTLLRHGLASYVKSLSLRSYLLRLPEIPTISLARFCYN